MGEIAILMPKMSMTMQEGTMVAWHRQPGDEVEAGDPVCDVATDKVDMEVESPASGTLSRIVAQPDEVVPVGQPIAYLFSTADDLLGDLLDGPGRAEAADATPETAEVQTTGTEPAAQVRRPAVPLARSRAAQLGVDLDRLTGTGAYGTVRVADVERAAAPTHGPAADAPAHVPAGSTGQKHSTRRATLRSAVARRLGESPRIPQFTMHADLDVTGLAELWTARVVAAWAAVLRASETLHASWRDGRIEPGGPVGVAVGVPTPAGLLTPVVRDPDLMPLADLDTEIHRLSAQAQVGRLAVVNLSGASTTVLDLGGPAGGPVIVQAQLPLAPPQATALAVGGAAPHPVATPAGVKVVTTCRIGLTVDQRVADPPDAVRALTHLNEVLNDRRTGPGAR